MNRGSIGAIINEINANIRTNHEGEITGSITNMVMKDIVDTLNAILSLFTTQEGGFFVIDDDLKIGMKYDGGGLDFAQISSHAIQVLKDAGLGGGGGGSSIIDVAENGFYFVDTSLNVGIKIDSIGIHAINLLEYEIIES